MQSLRRSDFRRRISGGEREQQRPREQPGPPGERLRQLGKFGMRRLQTATEQSCPPRQEGIVRGIPRTFNRLSGRTGLTSRATPVRNREDAAVRITLLQSTDQGEASGVGFVHGLIGRTALTRPARISPRRSLAARCFSGIDSAQRIVSREFLADTASAGLH